MILIFFIVFWFIGMVVVAWIYDACTRRQPPPPYNPDPIRSTPNTKDEQFAVAMPDDARQACLARVNQLAEAARPGWPYRVALTLLDSQLAVVRNEFNRLLITPSSESVPVVLEWEQYRDYRNVRYHELKDRLTRLSAQFRTELTPACDEQMPEQILAAVNEIVQSCQWIYQWGQDQLRYTDQFSSNQERPLGPRVADHVFRQVEILVADLRRALADPQFAGPLLFRTEFYYPKDEEVDRPVIGVLGAPNA